VKALLRVDDKKELSNPPRVQEKVKIMSNYLELTQLSDGTIVLRRADDHDNPIVKIEFGTESRDFFKWRRAFCCQRDD